MDNNPVDRDVLDLGGAAKAMAHEPHRELAEEARWAPEEPAGDHAVARHPKALETSGTPVEGSALSAEVIEQMTADIVAAIKTVYDPEIPADIYELGLIYKVEVDDDRNVDVLMTLTAPGCPVAGEMPIWVENAIASVAGVGQVRVELTFDPPWTMDRMSDEARLALNMF